MKNYSVSAAIAATLLLSGCAGGPTPIPDADSAAARLYAGKCGVCHALPHPKRHSAGEWPALIALMERRMSERGLDPLTPEQRRQLLSYLQHNGR